MKYDKFGECYFWICGLFLCTIVCVIKLHLEWQLVKSIPANYRSHSNSCPPHRVRNGREHLCIVLFLREVAERRENLTWVNSLLGFFDHWSSKFKSRYKPKSIF